MSSDHQIWTIDNMNSILRDKLRKKPFNLLQS